MARKRPIKPDDLFKLKAVGRVAISPDGRPRNRAERLRRMIAWFDKGLSP